ncbi:GAF domain-containing protein [Qingshengfaniella alkalisoli]|uniref:GAF domain-containing protein n=1 Tax=Qingshengfaniella alkalisoli TaxID=2599296 RepID=A0A5B8IWW2_9RHOB|nr:GAF domain-containing protein [Qingshengfaniella alkalisoli]QDY70632.1 GAF domain-containing protein [Qingshengfaniella alkalisoli]
MSDLATFTEQLSRARTQEAAYDALCALTKSLVGAKLFTVMTADMSAMLASRTYSDDPVNYPTSGTKAIEMNAWFDIVHGKGETFVANTLADIDKVFPDAELIGKLGCGSVINLPVHIRGEMVATVNILHEEQFYTPQRVRIAEDQLRLPAIATVAVAIALG